MEIEPSARIYAERRVWNAQEGSLVRDPEIRAKVHHRPVNWVIVFLGTVSSSSHFFRIHSFIPSIKGLKVMLHTLLRDVE